MSPTDDLKTLELDAFESDVLLAALYAFPPSSLSGFILQVGNPRDIKETIKDLKDRIEELFIRAVK